MTRLLTRGEQQARKYPRPHIPVMHGELSNLDRLDRGMPAETFGEPVRKESNAPFWFGIVGVIVVPTIVLIVGIVVAGA